MSIIRKFCSKCEERITGDETYYLQIFQRENRENRDTAFLCKTCTTKFKRWMSK